jgi:phage gpG-like protein
MLSQGGVTVYVKIYGEDGVQDYMEQIQDRANNLKPVFHWAKRELEKANAQNFETNGLPVGGWKPLSAEYASWKVRKFPGQSTLVRGGSLFRSLTSINGRDSEINDTTASFSTSIEYAKFHQYGTNKMPARKIVFEPNDFARNLGMKVVDHVLEKNPSADIMRVVD